MTSAGTVPVPEGVTLRDGFTGKEDQTLDFAVPYLDFGARQYSPSLSLRAGGSLFQLA